MHRSIGIRVAAFIAVKIVFNTALRMVYPFLPAFGRGLGVELTTLSRGMALRSGLGIFGPFLASTADTRGRKFGMLLGLAIFITANILIWARPSLTTFVLFLILTLIGYFAFNPSMQAYLGDNVAYQRRGLVLALTELGWSLSFLIGVPLISLLIVKAGWKSPFAVLAILGASSFGLVSWLIRRDQPKSTSQLGFLAMIGRVFKSKPALAGMLMGCTACLANEMVALTFGAWLEDQFGLKIAALGAAAMVIGTSELCGELLSAGFVDRIGKSRAVASGLIANCLAAVALVVLGRSIFGGMVGLFLFFLSFEFMIVSSIPLMTEILPEARATMMASFFAIISFGRAIGDLLAPWLYNLDHQFKGASGLEAIATGIVMFNLIALLALRFVKHQ